MEQADIEDGYITVRCHGTNNEEQWIAIEGGNYGAD